MKASRIFLIVSAQAIVLIAILATGQSAPQLINYQGRLTNASGQPLADGTTVDLTFAFYGVESGSTPLYLTVLQEDVEVSGGLYNVLIGSGTITPGDESTLAEVFQKHSNVWMGVKVDADAEMTPRAQITSVSYALQADKVNTGWWTNFFNKSDFDGDGYSKAIDGATATTDCDDGNASIYPGAIEVCDDGIDNDCDGTFDQDDMDCRPLTWTWISGSNLINQNGVYGTKGEPDPGNVPGARWVPVSWIDGSGNLWLFGGSGYAEFGGTGYLNDLWRWEGTEWTWISGSNEIYQHGVYGNKGVPDPSNVPGARFAPVSWIDGSGNLWLFGGTGCAASGSCSSTYLNDLWRWDGSEWTWMSGSTVANQYGVYGTKGEPGPANVPGSRTGAVSGIDSSGNLLLFGGYGYSASSSGELNDLWRWDGADWTWISGGDTANQNGVYGTKGEPDPANVPGSRSGAVSGIEGSGNLWLFGGRGCPASGDCNNYLNDLWRWDGAEWTWISGSNAPNQYGVYGTKGEPDPANVPGSRFYLASRVDGSGNFWLFGGAGYAESGSGGLNDLWRWDGSEWTWISGSNAPNQNGVYGTKGEPDPANVPGARQGAVSWIDSSGSLWLFGGYLGPHFNDLWRFY